MMAPTYNPQGGMGRTGGGGGMASAPRPVGGVQGFRGPQQQAQSNVPYQGMWNGNPRGAANMPQNPYGFQGQGQAPAWSQQTNLGRYTPPTMLGGPGSYNSNRWNNQGGYDYNLPGSYGSPLGQGQFAPMPAQFQQMLQQYFSQQQQQGSPMDYGTGGFGPSPTMQPGKDGTPLRIGPATQQAPMIPEFQPRQFQRYGTRPEDQVPGSAMGQMDWLQMYGDRGAYDREAEAQQAAYNQSQMMDYRNRYFRR